MSEQKHTQEPWHAHDELIHTSRPGIAGFHYAVADTLTHAGIDRPTMIANANRIVACVNACQGISTETLEDGVIGDVVNACVQLTHDTSKETHDRARAAIARLDGKQ